ncbi:DUF4232 domain-containing protein [Streptomyces maremycinicus]|uniref:DUF4232 domain-containing protein n=1 Tax=Streptomyces maremycinicus TaxID=1679753 RepID=UPI000787F49D|nr:DUF4232 domain-containing protein [Streptomyces sp. NBRC 110468]
MNIRHHRHRTALFAVVGTALALSLTACQGDSDNASGATAPSSTTSSATSAATAEGAGSTASENSMDSDATGGSTGSTDEQASTGTPQCTAKDVTVTAATQDGPPFTHLVLTAKNTSGRSCRLAGAPHLQFLESHKEDVPSVAKSKPATPVVLAAGAPAYALVKVSDGGVDEDNEPVSAFSLVLEGDSTVIAVTAPGSDGIAVDPAKALTGYWTPELRNGADDF